MAKFASEGFDLDALANAADDAILELGGNVISNTKEEETASTTTVDPLKDAEEFKKEGNEKFKKKEWQAAYELYSHAIDATPGMKGTELLQLEKDWQKEQIQKAREEMRKNDAGNNNNNNNNNDNRSDEDEKQKEKDPLPKFVPPKHLYGEKLSVYYCNRAASSLQIAQEQDGDYNISSPPKIRSAFDVDDNTPNNPNLDNAIQDCTVAILLNNKYIKAYVRRSTAYERIGDTEHALQDIKIAQTIDPYNSAIRMAVSRLQKLEDERLEKLKTETLDKLKDLGNSILGNFGLSLNNFQATKDPNTGSYSISFNQNNNNNSQSANI